jgi:hypothetical protein
VATDDPNALHRCRLTIIDINRTAKTVTWIEQPNPKADPIDCKDAEIGFDGSMMVVTGENWPGKYCPARPFLERGHGLLGVNFQ